MMFTVPALLNKANWPADDSVIEVLLALTPPDELGFSCDAFGRARPAG